MKRAFENGQTRPPRIGFDRFIPLDWAACALRIGAGVEDPATVGALFAAAGLGLASQRKSRAVLGGLWLNPRPGLDAFTQRGLALWRECPGVPVPALCWGMAVVAYPFFGKVAEWVGRLTALQGDCAAAEVHRRLAETHGDGEVTRRAANRVIQTISDWGTCERVDKGRRLVRHPATRVTNEALNGWLIEAAIRYLGRPLGVPRLQSLPVLYPFLLDSPLTFVVSRSPNLELRSEGPTAQVVAVR